MKTILHNCHWIGLSVAIVGLMAAQLAAQTPVAHWTFDDGIFDFSNTDSPNIQDPNNTSEEAVWAGGGSGITFSAGMIGGAAVLSGADGDPNSSAGPHFDIAELVDLDGATAASFTGWFNPGTSNVGQDYKGLLVTRDLSDSLTSGTSLWGIAWERNGPNVDARVQGVPQDSDPNIVAGDWYHVALVWDGDLDGFGLNPEKTLYVNGVEVASEINPGTVPTIITDSGSWRIGSDPIVNTRNFNGAIDDFAVFDVALTAGQVSTLYNNGFSDPNDRTINASGILTLDILDGDTNGNGVDPNDYFTIRDNMNTVANGRGDGDVTGDGFVTLDDFAEWKAAASPLVLLGAGFSVPEPSSLILIGLGSLFCLGRRRSRGAVPSSSPRRLALVLVCGLGFSLLGTNRLQAQDFVLEVDRDNNTIALTNTDPNTAIDFDYYRITSAAGSLAPGTITADPDASDPNAVDAADWNSLQDQLDEFKISNTSWRELGHSGNPPSRFALGEVKQLNSSSLLEGSPFALGPIFDITQAQIDAGFLVDVEDLAFEYGVPDPNGIGSIVSGTVSYIGEKIYNNLVLNLDDSGNATIENESQTTVNMSGYTIIATGGTGLDPNFAGITSEGGWDDANPTVGAIAQTNQLGAIELSPGETVTIGTITTTTLTSADLDFDFTLTDVGFDATAIDGIIKDIVAPGLDGDFNGDDIVNGLDFLVWQRGGSPNPLSESDLLLWQTNYGTSAVVANGGIVPEPMSLVLMFGALSVMGLRRHRR